MAKQRRIRVLIAKPGLDGHTRGATVVALGRRDAGMETIYTGIRQTPERIVRAAVEEDVDVIGLSSLSGGHKYLFPEVVRQLKAQGADDVLVIGGGIIPAEDVPYLKEKGVSEIFGPGTMIGDIAKYIQEHVRGQS